MRIGAKLSYVQIMGSSSFNIRFADGRAVLDCNNEDAASFMELVKASGLDPKPYIDKNTPLPFISGCRLEYGYGDLDEAIDWVISTFAGAFDLSSSLTFHYELGSDREEMLHIICDPLPQSETHRHISITTGDSKTLPFGEWMAYNDALLDSATLQSQALVIAGLETPWRSAEDGFAAILPRTEKLSTATLHIAQLYPRD